MANKLTAIIPLWDGGEFLPFLIPNLQQQVDEIVIVWSTYSNYGNEIIHYFPNYDKVTRVNWEPNKRRPPHQNETMKRNVGLQAAIENGATHVLMCDVDEFYKTDEFNAEKERVMSNGSNGLVCGLHCYFSKPTLTIGEERTRVPFIMKVSKCMEFGAFRKFPFAYDDAGARIDPTRRPNVYNGIEWSSITMHHYSWVRRDISRKINNSSAVNNLTKSCVMEDYVLAEPGYFCRYYQKPLQEVPNYFGIEI